MANNSPTPAPVVLFVYNRPIHTGLTLSALKNNRMAAESDLWVFSDGPKSDDPALAEKIGEVRKLINELTGFRSVRLIVREKNVGLANNIISGLTEVFEQYDRAIVVEDDLETSPHFLTWLNLGLTTFASEPKVFGISGFNYPSSRLAVPEGYPFHGYFNPRSTSWGWATWKDRWEKVTWDLAYYRQLSKDSDFMQRLRVAGPDLPQQIKHLLEGKINSWAVRFCATQVLNHAYSLYPTHSYVKNLGLDGSGTHCEPSDAQDVIDLNEAVEVPVLPTPVGMHPQMEKALRRMNRVPLKEQLKAWLGR